MKAFCTHWAAPVEAPSCSAIRGSATAAPVTENGSSAPATATAATVGPNAVPSPPGVAAQGEGEGREGGDGGDGGRDAVEEDMARSFGPARRPGREARSQGSPHPGPPAPWD
ncbi:hypothetical protein GCM10009760_46580 [Kitasatospora kazusensis]|uniref:Uncharacterized protein n=1 Tax=Kitasatospora kazusensis TaxID=407974 RepID=A0ABN3A0N7_9ACTN